MVIHDRLKPEAREAVASLQSMKVEVALLTGDNRRTALAIAEAVNIINIRLQSDALNSGHLLLKRTATMHAPSLPLTAYTLFKPLFSGHLSTDTAVHGQRGRGTILHMHESVLAVSRHVC